MQVFYHLIYEYKKGVRNMMLCTLPANTEEKVKARLENNNISYMIQRLSNGNINIFFGKEECVYVAGKICRNKMLNLLTPEEDFILGTLLGYGVDEQCRRFSKKQKENKQKKILSLS